jgi:DNA-binding transcriptional ArsR family regulator
VPAALQVIRDPQVAASALDPARLAILERLAEPNSAAGLARQTGIPRQKLNYHLHQLEKDGLVELVEERRKGNCMERIVRATARQYLISPEALGKLGSDAAGIRDRFSSAYLASAAARALRDLTQVRGQADSAEKRIATLTMEADIRFASAEARHQFANELAETVARLVAQYHNENAPGGRTVRLLIGAYPKPAGQPEPESGDRRATKME